MIHEVHGDTCRLGYLKVIACIVDDMEVRGPDFLASILYEMARQAGQPRHDILGLIRSRENAINYVELAAELDILRKGSWTAGETAITYSSLDAAKYVHGQISSGGPAQLQVLSLASVERIFFLNTLLHYDFHMVTGIIVWVLDHRRFTRNQAMEEIMETIYPTALRKALRESGVKMRQKILRKLEVAESFSEKRRSYPSRSEWVRSRQYAIYRHTLPPRLEWLVDLGILGREGRGKYGVTNEALKISRELRILASDSRERAEESVFRYIATSLLGVRSPDRSQIMEALLQMYNMLRPKLPSISLDLLKSATSYSLLEKGWAVSPEQVGRVFSNLALMFPDRVFVKPGHGGETEVTRLEIAPSEI
ncbi:MAG: hypothetical protein QXX57_04885 [Nitrososphaerota archaeon]